MRILFETPPGYPRLGHRDTTGTPQGHHRDTTGTLPGHRDTTGTPPGHHRDTTGTPPGHHRDTTGTLPGHVRGHGEEQEERRGEESRTRVRRKGQVTRMTRAQLRTHVTHDTNTEHDFPVSGRTIKNLTPPTSDVFYGRLKDGPKG